MSKLYYQIIMFSKYPPKFLAIALSLSEVIVQDTMGIFFGALRFFREFMLQQMPSGTKPLNEVLGANQDTITV